MDVFHYVDAAALAEQLLQHEPPSVNDAAATPGGGSAVGWLATLCREVACLIPVPIGCATVVSAYVKTRPLYGVLLRTMCKPPWWCK